MVSAIEVKALSDADIDELFQQFDQDTNGLRIENIEDAIVTIMPGMADYKEAIGSAGQFIPLQEEDFISTIEFKKLLNILAHYVPFYEQLKSVDTNGDGKVSLETIRNQFSSNLSGQNIPGEQLDAILNGNGQVDLMQLCLSLASSAADAPSRIASPRAKSRKHKSRALKSSVTTDGPLDGAQEEGKATSRLASPQNETSDSRAKLASPKTSPRSKAASPQSGDSDVRAKLASPSTGRDGLVSPPSRESRKPTKQNKSALGSNDIEYQSELLPIMETSANDRSGSYFPLCSQMTAEELHKMFRRFDAVDKNGKQVIDRYFIKFFNHPCRVALWEIENTARDVWPELFKHKAVMLQAYRSADESGDGLIEEPEFNRLMLYLACYIELEKDFDAIDTDDDRRISVKEFTTFYRKFGSKLSNDELHEAFKSIDKDEGGMILFKEFCHFFAHERMKELGLELPPDATLKRKSAKVRSTKKDKGSRSQVASPSNKEDASALSAEEVKRSLLTSPPSTTGKQESRSNIASPPSNENPRSKLVSPVTNSINGDMRAKLASPATNNSSRNNVVSPKTKHGKHERSSPLSANVDENFQPELLPIMEASVHKRAETYFPLGSQMTAEELHKMFCRFDAVNKNGKVALWEIENTARDIWPELFKRKDVMRQAYRSADESADGLIEEPEFSRLMLFLACYIELEKDFDAIDTDDDRRISLNEFMTFYRKIGSKLSDEKLEQAFRSIDKDAGGMILFKEFCNYFAQERMKELGIKLPVDVTSKSKTMKTPKEKSGARSNVVSPSNETSTKGKDSNGRKQKPRVDIKTQMTADELHEMFARFDTNGNGKVALWEIQKTVLDLWPELGSQKAAMMRAYKSADKNQDGYIEEPEFAKFMLFFATYIELNKQFEAIDADHDRRVGRDEFISFHRQLSSKSSDDQLSNEFDLLDKNGGGMILFEEFCEYYAKARANELQFFNQKSSRGAIVQSNSAAVSQVSVVQKPQTAQKPPTAAQSATQPQVQQKVIPQVTQQKTTQPVLQQSPANVAPVEPPARKKGLFSELTEDMSKLVQKIENKLNIFSDDDSKVDSNPHLKEPSASTRTESPAPRLATTDVQSPTQKRLLPWERPSVMEKKQILQQKPAKQYQLDPPSPQNTRHVKPLMTEKLNMERFAAAEPIVRPIIEAPPTTVGKQLSQQSEVHTLRRHLAHEQFERKRLEATIEALKNQIYSMGGRVDDGRVLKSRAGVESVTNLNQHLQDRLQDEQRKYRQLEQELMRANERIKMLELEGRRDYFEETKRSQSLNWQQMQREMRQERQERAKFETMFDESSRKLAIEQERSKRLAEELTKLKTFIRYQDRVRPVQ